VEKDTKNKQGRPPKKLNLNNLSYDIIDDNNEYAILELKYDSEEKKGIVSEVVYRNKSHLMVISKLNDLYDDKVLKIMRGRKK
jgi:hypothetical protein